MSIEVVRLSRRHVLQAAAAVFGGGLLVSLRSLADRVAAHDRRPRKVVVPPGTTQDLVFLEGVIVSRRGGTVRAFSAKCPHLGCEIGREVDGLLVCPCHGSRFAADGSVAAGPAARPLTSLPCVVDPATGAITVQL